MEKIIEITEVNNVNFGYKSKDFDGYCIETNIRKIYFVISNNQCCCEDWGYLTSEDNFNDYIGSKLKEVYLTNNKLETIKMRNKLEESAMFVNVETSKGLLQFVVYNEHNGWYSHDVLLVSKYKEVLDYIEEEWL